MSVKFPFFWGGGGPIFIFMGARIFSDLNRELVKAEVFEKRVFEQTPPLKMKKLRGHFSFLPSLLRDADD